MDRLVITYICSSLNILSLICLKLAKEYIANNRSLDVCFRIIKSICESFDKFKGIINLVSVILHLEEPS